MIIDASGLPGAMEDAARRLSDGMAIVIGEFTMSDGRTLPASGIAFTGADQPLAYDTQEILGLPPLEWDPGILDDADAAIPHGTAAVIVVGQDWFTRS